KVDVTSSSSEFGEAREQLAVEYQGSALAISFNAQYVLDFLNVVETDVVSLSLKDDVSQAVMKPVGAQGYDYTYVISPMSIEAGSIESNRSESGCGRAARPAQRARRRPGSVGKR